MRVKFDDNEALWSWECFACSLQSWSKLEIEIDSGHDDDDDDDDDEENEDNDDNDEDDNDDNGYYDEGKIWWQQSIMIMRMFCMQPSELI